MIKEYKISEIKNIKLNGRSTDCLEPYTLFWTGSGFEVNVKGRELWVEIEADYEEQEPWFTVLINGAPVSRQMAPKGRNKICLFRSRNPEEIKYVRFVKDSQAMHDDEKCMLSIHSLITDGVFCSIDERKLKIEFIGDSITSGEGIFGDTKEEDWVSMFFSGVYSYAALTAEKLKADYRIISQSGWGVLSSWDGNTANAIPKYYEKVCGLLTGDRNRRLGAAYDYDFKKWQPDVVVVNLGTNDGSAFDMPEFNHSIEEFENAVIMFLKKIRKYNPKADIIWGYGMLGYKMTASITRAVNAYTLETGDKKVHFINLPNTREGMFGSRQHPGLKSHKQAAEVLSDYIMGMI